MSLAGEGKQPLSLTNETSYRRCHAETNLLATACPFNLASAAHTSFLVRIGTLNQIGVRVLNCRESQLAVQLLPSIPRRCISQQLHTPVCSRTRGPKRASTVL